MIDSIEKKANILFQDNCIEIIGDLDFTNVMSIYEGSLTYLNQSGPLTFDFSQLASSNSAGLALLLEWIKYAKLSQKKIIFKNLSQALIAIARAANVDKLLGV